ncbi:beta-glucosidase BglX [Rubrolithibacter danxiaensis]|uniref:beta-glucosidase BglX n=1 Tax=Rubrolithibacter danxiaensis TaxID=3390805 RepID=UPI003BF794A9
MKRLRQLNFFYSLILLSGVLLLAGWISKEKEDPTTKKIDDLIAKMTFEEKAGQLNFRVAGVVTGPTATPMEAKVLEDLVKQGKVGGFFNGYGAEFTRRLQQTAMENSRLKIPLLFGGDVVHGFKTIFPIPLAQAASWDMDEIEKAERIAAIEASAAGINWTFAPMVDISRDPRWGRIAEGSGEDAYLGSKIAIARVKGFQGNDLKSASSILACTKHFAAYGAAEAGRDYNVADMSERTFRDVYLPPYKATIDAGVATFMAAFNEVEGVPAHGSDYLLNQILRKEWGFKGLVVSDYNGINEMISHGVVSDQPEAVELAIEAGVDMDMQGEAYINQLPKLVKEGKVSMATLDQAVRRVLKLKFDLGLFENPYKYSNVAREQNEILTKEHLDAAKILAEKSMVLLKNANNLLPLSKEVKTLAVIGPLANNKKDLNGTWAFFGNANDPVSILEGIKQKVSKNTKVLFAEGADIKGESRDKFTEAVNVAKQADVVVLCIGENSDMSGEAASRSMLDLPGVQQEFTDELVKTGKPLVVLLTSGRPLTIEKLDKTVPAILQTWFLGTQTGPAVASVLFGDYNPSGKLPVTFPRNVGQIPVYYNHKNTGRPYDEAKDPQGNVKYASKYLDVLNSPLYPFGYGLSYTSFDYSDIKLSKTEISMNEKLEVSVEVKNSGKRDGEEVVQLYVQDLVGSVTRPVKELKGFKKIKLKAGESKEVTFQLSSDNLAFHKRDMSFGAEPGKFKVFVGTSSADVKEAGFTLK